MQKNTRMNVVNVMFSNALRSKLTVTLFSEEATYVNVGAKVTCATGRHIVIFTNLQTFGKFRDCNFRIEKMLHVPAEKLPRLLITESVEKMLLQNQGGLFVLEVVGLLAPCPERALAFHEVPAHVQFGAKVFRTSLLPVEIPTKLDGHDRLHDKRTTFVGNEKETRVNLEKRTHAIPLRSLFQQTHDSLYLLDLQNVFEFQNTSVQHYGGVDAFGEVYFQFVI